ncbi:YcnI family protein [Amycolatopsis minnesotensis]|uniref:YcnI family protein n=1 Tax=Amycolatopsis minnesotensis TaxID=337894 RepID=A0ABP5CQ04_9PSEU
MATNRAIKRAGFVAATVGVTGLLGAGIASAHVTANVYGTQPSKGGYGAIFLRVPNEEPDAGTTKVEVTLKPEYAISSGRAKPVPGWTAQVTKEKLPAPVKTAKGTEITEAVTKITWTAQPGTKIAAGSGEFQEFEISVGALPDLDQIELPAAQTYENGKVVNWNEPAPPNGEEPEHPAPTVKLAAAESGHHGAAPADASHSDTEAAAPAGSTDNTARWLGGAGLVVGALGLGFGAGATIRARKTVTNAKAGETGASSE